MKCPNCGMEIPEGHMYCDNCGNEINFVPDFEPEVENQINATLSGVADELNKEDRLKEERRKKKQAFLDSVKDRRQIIIMTVAVVALLLGIIAIIPSFVGNSANSYLKDAESTGIKTTAMGSMFRLSYKIRMKDPAEEKSFIDELRTRNGNLEISILPYAEQTNQL